MKKTVLDFLSKVFSKPALLICITTLLSFAATAQTNIFNVASGNWNTASNWSLNHVPNGVENLEIPAGNTCNMDINFNVGNTNTVFTITLGGTLNIPSGATLDRVGVTLLMNTDGATLSGGGTVHIYNLTINTPNATDVVNITNSSATTPITIAKDNATGTINFTKGILKLTGQTLAIAKTATINGNGGNFANAADGVVGHTNADGGTLLLKGDSGGTTTVNGSVTFNNISPDPNKDGNVVVDFKTTTSIINGTATLINQQGKLGNTNSPIWGASSALIVAYKSGFNYNPGKEWVPMASGTIGVTPGYPNNVLLSNTGTSAGNGYGWAPSGAWAINGVFTLGNNATNAQVNFGNLTSFTCGGFVLNTNSRFAAPSTMTVNGNWTNNQPVSGNDKGFIIGTSTVVFGGTATCSAPNTITGPAGNTEAFYSLTINSNTALLSPVSVNVVGSFVLTSVGILTTTSTNSLTINNTATNAITGGTSSSYINGPVKWNLAAASGNYMFPLGDGTCTPVYLPLVLNKTAGNAVTATAQAFNVNSGGSVDATLSSLGNEYWSLSTSGNLATGSKVSISRPTPIAPLAFIAKSSSQTGVYTSLGGTAVTNGVNNSTNIGTTSPWFFALGAGPIISTLFPTLITTTSATLQGAFNTQNSSRTTSFDYGTTTGYGTNVVTLHSPINSNSSQADSVGITGLTANTEYHVKATDGTNSGSDVKFFTAPNPPVIAPATNLSGSGFTSNWAAPAAQGPAPFTYTVQISTDPNFGSGVTEQTGIASGTLSSGVSGLTSATTYYIRVKAVNETTSSAWSATETVTTDIVPTAPCTTGNGSPGTTGTITSASTAPIIDGTVDAVWNTVPSNDISVPIKIINNAPAPPTNNTATWKTIWDANYLYILVEVKDASLVSQGAFTGATIKSIPPANLWDVDGIEFYLDGNNGKGGAYDNTNDYQLRFNLGSSVVTGVQAGTNGSPTNLIIPNINFSMVPASGGYLLEAAIPWNGPGGVNSGAYPTVAADNKIGIDFSINDNDDATGDRDSQFGWYDKTPEGTDEGSSNQYNNTKLFGTATLAACPQPPVVILPTATNITATSATLGATVTSSGDGTLTTRGTGYTVSPIATGTSNALAEGGTAISAYSGPARTGLSPQTQYYYLGYANNSNGVTGVSNVASFYTLSALPTTTPQLTTVICPGITLNWTAPAFPPANQATQTGYLILRRQDGSNPTSTGIATRVATKQADLPAGTTLLATIPSGATLTYSDVSVVAGTTYNYLLVPFTWDGVATDSTYNYAIGAGSASTSATATGSAIITPAFTQIAPICAGGTFTLPTTSTNGVTGTWLPAINNQGTTLYTFTPDQGQCAVTATMSVTVTQLTPPSFTQVAPICAGGTFTLPTTSTNGVTGTWSPAINNQGTTEYTFTPSQGQCATTYKMTVTVNQPTPPSFTQISPICAGGTFTLPTTSTNGVTGTWSPAINNQGTTEYTFTPNQGVCATTYKMTVTVFAKPTVTASADPITVGSGGTVTLTGTSSTQGIYSWSASPQTTIQSANTTTASSNPTANTKYTFTVTYGDGCSTSDDVDVTFNDLTCLDPMKGFTPNGDGKNEKWQVYRDGSCFANVSVDVYNRWGGLVYHADKYNNDWTGQYKGKNIPDATYYYVVKATDYTGRTQIKTGNVTIIR